MRIFIDCTDTHFSGSNSGIQRVVRNVVAHAVALGPQLGVECVPVAYDHGAFWPVEAVNPAKTGSLQKVVRNRLDEWFFRIAHPLARVVPFAPWRTFVLAHRRDFGLAWLLYRPVVAAQWLSRSVRRRTGAAPVRRAAAMAPGDILYLPDAAWFSDSLGEVKRLHAQGVRVVPLLYDVIPLTHPEFCHPAHLSRFMPWLDGIQEIMDALLCISRASLLAFEAHRRKDLRMPGAAVTYLGYDLPASPNGDVRHPGLSHALATDQPVYLCVGTIDARKNQSTLLDAFERLWAAGDSSRLVLVGSVGWKAERIAPRIRGHARYGRQLFWFDDVRDADLALAYARARALVFPSLAEGFGLPIVEALSRGAAVLASDIPVFREIVGSRIQYFNPLDARDIARAVAESRQIPAAGGTAVAWLTWDQSTRGMLEALVRLCPPP